MKRRIAVIAAAMSFVAFVPANAVTIEIDLSRPLRMSGLSGFQGGIVDTLTNVDRSYPLADRRAALVSLGLREKNNKPCWLKAGFNWIGLPRPRSIPATLTHFLRKCTLPARGSELDAAMQGRYFVTGVRVCTNPRSRRVKGIRLYGYIISGLNGTISGPQTRDEFHRPNCRNNWQDQVTCPANYLVTGVEAHFIAATGEKAPALTGLRLICRPFAVRQDR